MTLKLLRSGSETPPRTFMDTLRLRIRATEGAGLPPEFNTKKDDSRSGGGEASAADIARYTKSGDDNMGHIPGVSESLTCHSRNTETTISAPSDNGRGAFHGSAGSKKEGK